MQQNWPLMSEVGQQFQIDICLCIFISPSADRGRWGRS